MLLLVWIASGLYTASLLDRGWVPHDEGAIAQSAQRILDGQLPHRDFDELYTGGLSYLNALSFRLFGENLLSPRIMLFLFFLAWVPAVFWSASRFTDSTGAGAVTLLAVVWSIPNYSAALPSWYNLFFATFGIVALLVYFENPSRKWLFAAGLCCGISFLFKLSGIYFAAGVLLWLVYREQELCRSDPRGARPQRNLYSLFVFAGMAGFVVAVVLLARHGASAVVFVEFVLPGLLLAFLCASAELAGIPGGSPRRFASFFGMLLPFATGAGLPVLLFLLPYVKCGALPSFLRGVFVLPSRRLAFATQRPPGFGPVPILAAIILSVLLFAAYQGKVRSKIAHLVIGLGLFVVLLVSKSQPRIYSATWDPLLLLIPLSTLAGLFALGDPRHEALARERLMLLLAIAATCSLIQLPFSAAIYFCYVAPLVGLSLLALYSVPPKITRPLLAILLAFYLAFAVFRVTPGFLYSMGYLYQPNPETASLKLPRSGDLRVSPADAAQYQQLIPEIQAHAGTSNFIYAAPDCPEIYFLAGKQNPTRALFDFFADPITLKATVMQAIEAHNVQVVAIYYEPKFSGRMSNDLLSALVVRFPNGKRFGDFEVRWRP